MSPASPRNKPGVIELFGRGLWKENPVLKMLLGMCPTLAVTTSAGNALGMGLSTLSVLAMSNIVISFLRGIIPAKLRIPSFIVVIASFVTIIDLLLHAYFPELHKELGIFIPLIVVNCIILGRAEAFASKNNVFYSLLDGIAMGVGFTAALVILGSVRELLGGGSIFGVALLPGTFPEIIVMILPPGAFITLGFMLALVNYIDQRRAG